MAIVIFRDIHITVGGYEGIEDWSAGAIIVGDLIESSPSSTSSASPTAPHESTDFIPTLRAQ